MKRALILGCFLGVILFSPSRQASADNYYRINMRAYRKMLHYQLPHPFADRFWGVVDNHLLQSGGPLDQLINAILAKNISGAGQQSQQNDNSMIAQTPAVPDPVLTATDAKVRAMCLKLNIQYVEIPQVQTQRTTSPQNTSGMTNLDDNFSIPAPVPPGFVNPPDL